MKSLITSSIILFAIIASMIGGLVVLNKKTSEIADTVSAIQAAGQEGRWDDARNLAEQGGTQWDRARRIFTFFKHHAESDIITTGFIRMREFLSQDEQSQAMVEAAQLSYLLELYARKDMPRVENIF